MSYLRKRKTKTKDGGIVLHGKQGTHASSTFVFKALSVTPAKGDIVRVCPLAKHQGTYYLGERDWDTVFVDDVQVRDKLNPSENFIFFHLI